MTAHGGSAREEWRDGEVEKNKRWVKRRGRGEGRGGGGGRGGGEEMGGKGEWNISALIQQPFTIAA